MALIWTFLAAILLISLFHHLIKKKKTGGASPPSPRAIPLLGHFHLLGKNPHQDLFHLAKKHGPIMGMRFGFVNAVIISSPAAAEKILKTHDLSFAGRPHHEASKYISYDQRNLIFGQYGPYWRNMRKLCTLEMLSNFRINQFGAMRRAELGLFVDSLKQSAVMQRPVDLSTRLFTLSGDMNSLMVLGRKYSDGEIDEKGFKSLFIEVSEAVGKFNLGDYFPYIGKLDLHGLNRRMIKLNNIFDDFFEKIIDEHVENKEEKTREDFVDTMMRIMESKEAGFKFDRRHVKAVLLDLLIAGSDTSSATVDWALSELMKNPSIMKKVQDELESVVGMDQMVDESHMDKLHYLDCVIKETFRLHPIVPLLIPHEAVEDFVIDGFHIPKKSRITINAYAIGRDPNVWSEPDRFNPDRFIGSSVDVRGHDFELIPFGAGRRGCPGMQLGLTVVKLVLAQMVHCFDWELPNGMLPAHMDMSEHFAVVTARAQHLEVIPRYRLTK